VAGLLAACVIAPPAQAGFWSWVAGQGHHHTLLPHRDHHLIGDGRLRDDFHGAHGDDREHHDRNHHNKHHHLHHHDRHHHDGHQDHHLSKGCLGAEMLYRFRHGFSTPDRLRGFTGCTLYELDADYHSRMRQALHSDGGRDPIAEVAQILRGV
jgi:hypothetical protein